MSTFSEKYNQYQREGIELYPFLWNENAYKWEELVKVFEAADFPFLELELGNIAAINSTVKEINLLLVIESLANSGKFSSEERARLADILKSSREIGRISSRIDAVFALGERSVEYFRSELESIETHYPLWREGLLVLADIFSELWDEELFLRTYKLYFSVGIFHFDHFRQSEYFFNLSKERKLQFIREIISILPSAANEGVATNFFGMSEESAKRFFGGLENEGECLFDLLSTLIESYFKNHMPHALHDALKWWVVAEICRRLAKENDSSYFLKLFRKIASSENANLAYTDWIEEVFQRLITKTEIKRLIEMEKETPLSKGVSNYSLYLYQFIEARKLKGYTKILEEFKKWIPEEISRMKDKQAENLKRHHAQLKERERETKSEIRKGFSYYKKGILRNGFFLLQEFEHNEGYFSKSQREDLKIVVRDLFEKEEFDPKSFEYVKLDENRFRTNTSITTGSFDRALKVAEKLGINLADYRERLVALIPFAYSEAFWNILKILKSLSLGELQYLAQIYSQESDLALHLAGNFPQAALESVESLLWAPRHELEAIMDSLSKYLDRSDIHAWTKEQIIKLFKTIWVDSSFFKALFVKHTNPGYNFFRDYLPGNLPEDLAPNFRMAVFINAILIERQDEEAVRWRVNQLAEGAIEFDGRQKDMVSGVIRVYSPSPQENELEHEQSFLEPLWKLAGEQWWEFCFKELLQYTLGLEERYAGYARYVQRWVAIYLKASGILQGNIPLFRDIESILDSSATRLAENFRINNYYELKKLAGEITSPQDEERFDLKAKLSYSEDRIRELEQQNEELHEQISIAESQKAKVETVKQASAKAIAEPKAEEKKYRTNAWAPAVTPENQITLLVEGVTELKILNSLIDKKILSRFPSLESRLTIVPCGWVSWVINYLDGHILGELPGISIGLLDFDYEWWMYWFTGTTKNWTATWKSQKDIKWTSRRWLYKIHAENKRCALALLPVSNEKMEHQVLEASSAEESEDSSGVSEINYCQHAEYSLEHMFYGIEYDWAKIDEFFRLPQGHGIFSRERILGGYKIVAWTNSEKRNFRDYVCDIIQRDASAIPIFSPLLAIFSLIETIVKEIETPSAPTVQTWQAWQPQSNSTPTEEIPVSDE